MCQKGTIETVYTRVVQYSPSGPTPQDVVTVDAFYTTDMNGKCLSKATFKAFSATDMVACYKVMPRSQVRGHVH